jgi:CRP-like cAMP-binding protein
VIEPYVYIASASTTEPSEVIAIPGDRLRALCDGNMTIGYQVFRAISGVMSRRFGHALGRYGSEELHRFKIFAQLDADDLDAVAKISHVKEYPTGQELTTEGEDADRLYLFLRGKAVVKVHSPEGVEVLIDQVGSGELLGWSAAVEPHVYTASSWTTEPSEVIVVPGPELRRLCETNKHIGYAVARGIGEVISRRFGHAIGRHGDLREKDLRAFGGEEHVLWENGEVQLTTEAVLIGMGSDSPDVLPLDALLDAEVRGDSVIFHAHGGDVTSPPLDRPERLVALVRDAMLRTRRAHRRTGE